MKLPPVASPHPPASRGPSVHLQNRAPLVKRFGPYPGNTSVHLFHVSPYRLCTSPYITIAAPLDGTTDSLRAFSPYCKSADLALAADYVKIKLTHGSALFDIVVLILWPVKENAWESDPIGQAARIPAKNKLFLKLCHHQRHQSFSKSPDAACCFNAKYA
jgi:hypothetical protein